MQQDLTEKINHLIKLYSSGNSKAALIEAQLLIQAHPNVPFLHNIEAACLMELGQPETAVSSFKKALAIKPDYYQVHINLGSLLIDLGQVEAAIASFQQALRINPDLFEAHTQLGRCYLKLNQANAAVESFKQALQFSPDDETVHNNLGTAYTKMDNMMAAAVSYQRAVAINPDYVLAHKNLALTLGNLGQLDAAVESYQRLLAVTPGDVEALVGLSFIYERMGHPDEAITALENALEIDPDHAAALKNVIHLKTQTRNDPRLGYIEQLLSSSKATERDRVYLNFALAKAYDDTGEYDRSFSFLKQGNRLCKKELDYGRESSEDLFSKLMDIFALPAEFLNLEASDERHSKQPIFVVGMPRSGTTLVEQILASHSRVFGAGELNTLNRLSVSIFKKYRSQADVQMHKGKFDHDISSLRTAYLDSLNILNVSENIITDKMPTNFRWIGFMAAAFPEAKIVHLNRDPMATCWSIYKHFFSGKGNKFAYDMADLAHYYGLYIDLMDFWRKRFPNKIYDICYEDLTENQAHETRELLDYCGLEWEDTCLDFHKTQREVKTASLLQVRKKMYTGSSEAWRKYEKNLQPLIDGLNYQG